MPYKLKCYQALNPNDPTNWTPISSAKISDDKNHIYDTTCVRIKIDTEENVEFFAHISIIPIEGSARFAVNIQRAYSFCRSGKFGLEGHDTMHCPARMFIMRAGDINILMDDFGNLRMLEIERCS